jgi:hypothetical protein
MSARAKEFAETWVANNVHNEPLAYGADYDPHIRGLLGRLLAYASNAGIEKEELESAIGNPEDFVAGAFERVFDPTVGLIKHSRNVAERALAIPAPGFGLLPASLSAYPSVSVRLPTVDRARRGRRRSPRS